MTNIQIGSGNRELLLKKLLTIASSPAAREAAVLAPAATAAALEEPPTAASARLNSCQGQVKSGVDCTNIMRFAACMSLWRNTVELQSFQLCVTILY
jgi:hypothetical protein